MSGSPVGVTGARRAVVLLADRDAALARAVLAEGERDEARRQLVELQGQLQARPDHDAASGVASRQRLDEALDGEWRRARRNGSHLSLVVLDVGHSGASMPDRPALRLVDLALALKGALRRGGDLLASCGSGRFAAMLPEVGAAGAATVAEALRRAARTVAPELELRLGVASLRPQEAPGSGPQALLAQAETALA
jgi:GGDEF domain-containing protein